MNREIEKAYTALFLLVFTRWGLISDFRQMAKTGLPLAADHMTMQTASLADSLNHDPEYKEIIKDQKFDNESVLTIVKKSTDDFEIIVDATSLIFAHSVLDSIAYDCCKISIQISPDDWRREIQKKKIALRELFESGQEKLVNDNLRKLLSQIERIALNKKIEYIFKRCPPPEGRTLIDGYNYNSERLSRLDRLRHDIVHSNKPITRLPKADDDLFFMRQTCFFLLTLLKHKYKIKIDLALLPEILLDN